MFNLTKKDTVPPNAKEKSQQDGSGGKIVFSIVMRVYVPRFFVSSQQRFGVMDIKALGASQLLGLGQTVL